ncbi:MAG TPA: zinc ribbon domain-containing protein [Candidatus Flavonifractor intestinipullorum]|uniref:Zinc ribbon domain-containing protein n=1 Tax=Candidatus Flavonifractor intestinipullorum TaxID=2838587 RepID=A0A9D2M9K2_9FIRM|nr:zinc ribbon domain-containing protein [Candidatus Flavonifractor intestinipullorum]
MFCGKCGAPVPDGAAFCPGCGNPVRPAPPAGPVPPVTVASPAPRRTKYRLIGLAAIALAVLLVVVLVTVLFGGRSYRKAVDQLMRGVMETDAGRILDVIPDEVTGALGYSSRTAAEEGLNAVLSYTTGALDEAYGPSWSYTYKIDEREPYSSRERMDLQERYARYGYDLDLSDALEVEVELTIRDAGGRAAEQQDIDLTLIRLGRNWYLDIFHMGGAF